VGARIGIARRYLVLAVLLGLGAMVVPATPAWAASGNVALSIPAHYIANYTHRAKQCVNLVTPPWVQWLSYAEGTVSDEWVVTASGKKLCHKARTTSDAVIVDIAPHNDGAGQTLDDMIAWAEAVSNPLTRRAPKPAGASWKCMLLPSFWGENARTLGKGAVTDRSLAPASGPAAGAGFCEKGTTRTKGKFVGGAFFTWTPDTPTCKRRYRLKEVPDPSSPGSTKPISPFPANLWGDYDQIPC
jgi:hypothetical protein